MALALRGVKVFFMPGPDFERGHSSINVHFMEDSPLQFAASLKDTLPANSSKSLVKQLPNHDEAEHLNMIEELGSCLHLMANVTLNVLERRLVVIIPSPIIVYTLTTPTLHTPT